MSTTSPSNSEDKEETKQCRICLSGPEDEKTCGRLIKPCMCKGSMRYVHVKCLNRWRISSGSKSAFYSCDTCHYSYAFARTSVVGLATSPAVSGIASILLFTAIVFLASFIIVLFIPSLATPPYSLETQSIQQYFIMNPVNLANRIISIAVRSYNAYTYSWWWGYDDEWDPLVEDVPPPPPTRDPGEIGLLATLIHRFVLGLSAVGSLSFIAWVWQMSLLGPLRFRVFRSHGRDRRNNASGFATILVVIFIFIGVARAIRNVYIFNRSCAQRILATVEDVILEVA